MNPDGPAWTPGLMPPEVPVAEVRHFPTLSVQEHGDDWHGAPVDVLIIEPARHGMVTVGVAGWVGQDTHLYEIDLTPAAAEEAA